MNNKARLLVVSYNHEHPNDMYISYYKGLSTCFMVDFYGPGFSTKEDLEAGLLRFYEKNGPYDAIMIDFELVNYTLGEHMIQHMYSFRREIVLGCNLADLYRYADKMLNESSSIDAIRIVHGSLDIFYLREFEEKWLKILLNRGCFFEWYGEELIPDYERTETYICGVKANNDSRRIVQEYKKQIISNPINAISEYESCFSSLESRSYDWTLPGSIQKGIYDNRCRILEAVKSTKIRIFDAYDNRNIRYKQTGENTRDYLNKSLEFVSNEIDNNCHYIFSSLKMDAIAMYREKYSSAIKASKMAYADGGNGCCLVRKYFEIPVRGTVLLCEKFCGMELLGFQNGENMILVDVQSIEDVIMDLLHDPAKMSDIADRGRRFVLDNHTFRHRAENVRKCLESIENRTFDGTYWKDGKMLFR